MDYLPTIINAAVIALVGVVITYVTRTQIQDLRNELKEDIAEVKQELRTFRTEVNERFSLADAALRSEIGAVRSDLTQVALAVGAGPRPQTG